MHNQENRITKQPHVKILWTGGFDSSCRMVQLSKYPVTVQPYYLRDNRVSEQKELEAIAAITSDIENHPETKCIILPLIQFNVADIKPDPEITEGYRRIRDLTGLGSQYDWLASELATPADCGTILVINQAITIAQQYLAGR